MIVLLEGALVQLPPAERTHKVLRMELLAHRRHAATADRLVARMAQTAALLVVVHLAQRQSIVVEERTALEADAAVL